MAVLHGFCERLLPGSVVITTTRKLPPPNPKASKVKGKGKMKGKQAAAVRAQQRQQVRHRPGVRCRLVLQSSTLLSSVLQPTIILFRETSASIRADRRACCNGLCRYAKGRLTFHIYHAQQLSGNEDSSR
jgi:hypothetical protein